MCYIFHFVNVIFDINKLFIYLQTIMFSHISVPKILILFLFPFNPFQFPSLSFQLLLPASTNFEAFLFFFFLLPDG